MPGARHLDDPVEQLVHHDGAYARGGLVQHQHLGLGHQRAADRHLLTLPAAEFARRLTPLVAQNRNRS